MVCFGEFWVYFVRALARKKCYFSTWSGDLMDVKDVLLGSSEYAAIVMGLVSVLLHRSSLMLEILKHNKIWGTVSISVHTSNSGGLVPRPPRDLSSTLSVRVPESQKLKMVG